MNPCMNCPFLRYGHIAISPEDASDLIEFVLSLYSVAICHKTQDTNDEKPCRGAVLFKNGGDARIFSNAEEMIAAHAKTEVAARHSVYGIND